MASSQQLRETLLRTDEEFRRLSDQHHDLEIRLNELSRQLYSNGPEELEKVTLKKKKLQLKDRMEQILRERRSPAVLTALESSVRS